MKKKFLGLTAIILGIVLTAYNTNNHNIAKEKVISGIKNHYSVNTNVASWAVFEYVWGPHNDPESYVKIPYEYDLSEYCPGIDRLCAIFAEEDILFNPGHPTLGSLNFLLGTYGFFYYFPYEVTGLVEFKSSEQ